jgi:hypothetical protein
MCTVLLPPGANTIALNKYNISYRIISKETELNCYEIQDKHIETYWCTWTEDCPLWAHLYTEIFSYVLRAVNTWYFKQYRSVGDISTKELHIAFNDVTCTKLQIAAVRERVNRNYSRAISLEKRDLNSGVCSHLFSCGWRNKQIPPDSDLKDEGWFC